MNQEQIGFLLIALGLLLITPLYGFFSQKINSLRILFFAHYISLLILCAFFAVPILMFGAPALVSIAYLFSIRKSQNIEYKDAFRNLKIHTFLYGLWPLYMFSIITVESLFGFLKGNDAIGMIILFTPITACIAAVTQIFFGIFLKKIAAEK